MKVKVEHIIDFPIAGEKDIIFSLNGNIYEAFYNEGKEFKVGETIEAKLFLLDFTRKKTDSKLNLAKFSKEAPLAINNYKIWAKVLSLNEKEITLKAENDLVFNIKQGKQKFKEGDVLYLEGRLDIERSDAQ